jgi:heat shock protein HslJ
MIGLWGGVRDSLTPVDIATPVGLIGVEWTLQRFVVDGVEHLPGDYPNEVTLRFSRGGLLSGTDGCNWFSTSVAIDPDHVILDGLVSTRRGCRGEAEKFSAILRSLLFAHPTWSLDDGVLTVAVGTTAVIYEARTSIYPSDRPGRAAPLVLAQGQRGTGDYRLSYSVSEHGVHLSFESRDEPGLGWGCSSLTLEHDWAGPQPNGMACSTARVDGDLLVVGLVIDPAQRVVFRAVGHPEVDLDTYALPEAVRHTAYSGFVGQPERGSELLVLDSSGTVLGPPLAPH